MKRSRRSTFIIATSVLAFLFLVQSAWAWGPATHIQLASRILENLGLLPEAVAVLLARYARAYLYGNIAADIVFAKRLSRVRQFCHHWSTAFEVLKNTKDDDSKAFAYGYLSHLAADTVAHGKYVPRQITLTGATVNFGHLYWELRADKQANEHAWKTFSQVMKADHTKHHHLMAQHLRGTFLPYEVNRILFERLNAAVLRPAHRRTVAILDRYSRYELPDELLQRYHAECVDRTLSLLRDGAKSPLLHEDPNGTAALMQTKILRKGFKQMKRRGLRVGRYLNEIAESLSPRPTTGHLITPESE